MGHDARSILDQGRQQPLTRANGLVLVLDTPKDIEQGAVVDISPVLIFTPAEVENQLEQTCLNHYTYLFNHSTLHQNVGWRRDCALECIVYTALRDIAAGEELCISYGNGRLWFEDADGTDHGHDDNNAEHAREQGEDEHTVEEDARQSRSVLEMSGLSGIETDSG
ncbi:hypothetical protein DV735_g1987, partial [Chaetothyriales sp. CBS 134920]